MADKELYIVGDEELKELENLSGKHLPNRPGDKGWSADQIRRVLYQGNVYLFGLLKDFATSVKKIIEGDEDDEEYQSVLTRITALEEDFIDIPNILVNKAKADQEGNNFITTYAKIANIVNGTIGALKYIKKNNTLGTINDLETAITTNLTNFTNWVNDNFSNNKAKVALLAEKATKDGNGNNIIETYATIAAIQELFKTCSFSSSGDNASLIFTTKAGTPISVNLTLANGTNAGLMSPSDVNAIANIISRLANLEKLGFRLSYTTKANPTASEILAFVQASGFTDTDEYPHISVVVDATKHIWYWYSNLEAFKDEGLDTIEQFTNSSAGAIKGSNARGKVYAENDGTGSVVGWDDLNNDIASQYDNTTTYEIGDMRIYEGKLYRCNTAIDTAEDFDSAKWDLCNISQFVKLLNAAKHAHGNKATLDAITAAFTTALKTKLDGIEAGAKVNVLEGIQVDGVDIPIVGKKVNITNKQDNLGLSIVDGKICMTY